MGLLKVLILGSAITIAGCASAKDFSQDFAKKWGKNFENRYSYDKNRGKIKNVIKAEEILRDYPTLEDYFYKNREDYNEFFDELKNEFGRLAEKAADKSLNEYMWYKNLKNLFKCKFSYGYHKQKKREKRILKQKRSKFHTNDTWPFAFEGFRIKGGAKLSTKFHDYFDKPFYKALNPELYCKLMNTYTISFYPVKNELKQKLKLRYGNVEGNIYHKFKENFEVEKIGIGLHCLLTKDSALNLMFSKYIKLNKSEQENKEFSIVFSTKF